MEQVIARLSRHIADIPDAFRRISPEAAAAKTAPDKWSAKEIFGHLCDSAVNNLGRFVSAQSQQPYSIIGYQQNQWVAAQGYQSRETEEIVQLWASLNQSILHVMMLMDAKVQDNVCIAPDGSTVTLRWLMEDYVAHLEHHLGQIFTNEAIS